MPSSSEQPAPRIPFPDPAQQSEAVGKQLAQSRGLNVMRMLSHATESVFSSFNRMMGGILFHSKLDAVLREVAILRVGYLSNARYEIYHHEAMARGLGMTEPQLAAIRAGSPDAALTAEQQAVLAFTSELVQNVKAGEQTLAAVRAVLNDNQLMDLMVTIGGYMTLARILETAEVPLEASGPIHVGPEGDGAR